MACPEPTVIPDGGPSLPDDAAVTIDAGPCSGRCDQAQVCHEANCWSPCPCEEGQFCDETASICREGCQGDEDCPLTQRCSAGLCEPGCREDARCPAPQICHEEACRAPFCTLRTDCETGEGCRSGRCEQVGQDRCEADGDCGLDWTCSSHGLCFTGECLVHDDCEAAERCVEGACVRRPRTEEGILFERRFPAYAASHNSRLPFGETTGYGFGGALLDVDGDGDLDLFMGSRIRAGGDASPACIYENVSVPSRLDFRPWPGGCPMEDSFLHAGVALDLEGDGFDELVVLGNYRARLLRFFPEPAVTDLITQLDEDDPRRRCVVGAGLPQDLNMDGRIDLMLGCQIGANMGDLVRMVNMTFLQNPEGRLELVEREAVAAWADPGSTLGLAGIDVDWDGMEDLVVLNDTFSTHGVPGSREEGLQPTIQHMLPVPLLYRRCSPLEACDYEPWSFGEGDRAYGSFMGLGAIHIEGEGEHFYISDWGFNRLMRFGPDGTFSEIIGSLGGGLSHAEDVLLFAWGVLVDDLNRDGRDDLLVSQGMVPDPHLERFPLHYDAALLQHGGGFEVLSEEVGLSASDHLDSQNEDRSYASRAMARADLDGDGYLDVVTFALEGKVRFHAEVPQADGLTPRCTLIPRPRYVPAYGTGYALQAQGGTVWRRRDVQGQSRLGSSPHILNPEGRGTLRFPSGYRAAFDCQGRPGPFEVTESEWIQLVTLQDGEVSIKIAADQVAGERLLVVFAPELDPGDRRQADLGLGACDVEEGWCLWQTQFVAEEQRLMLRLGSRWIPRWFTASAP
ncbi:MAG: hypothetical protein CMH55_05435 [Myxococcales bacterium]|nr:hypothetical protein [Myxococcales bacterium]